MKRRTYFKRYKKVNKSSVRYDKIEQVLFYIREIKKIENGNKCDICGRHQDQLPFPLSSFHILPRSKHPRLTLYQPNIIISCWSKLYYIHFCHNDYHHLDRDSVEYKNLVSKIELKIGLDIALYKERLKIAEISMPKLSLFQIETQEFVLRQEYERLKKKAI